MNNILLSIGSNNYSKTNIDKAKRMLTYLFPSIRFSSSVLTGPREGSVGLLPFRNILAVADNIEQTPTEVISLIKETEKAIGRKPVDKYKGKVVIDIDLLQYNDEIVRPEDYAQEYVQYLLPSLEWHEPEQNNLSEYE